MVAVRKLAGEVGLEYAKIPSAPASKPVAVSLSSSKHRIVVYAGMMHATVDGEVWSLGEAVQQGERDLFVSRAFRSRLARHLRIKVPGMDPVRPVVRKKPGLIKGRMVVIDPGHGGKDPGALGRRIREKDLVLDVGRRLSNLLRGAGVQVVMTRKTDVFIELNDRVRIANRYNPDLFVSIHADSFPRKRSVQGSTVFYPDDKPGSGKGDITYRARLHARSTSVEPGSVGSPGRLSEPVEAVVFGVLLQEYRSRSHEAATRILQNLTRIAGTTSRGVKQADFRVVRYMRCPTVLVELDFLSNPSVERRFGTASYKQRLAQGLADGITSYLRSVPVN
jgi:N-acetylmuramoyl-L-alanine amidase